MKAKKVAVVVWQLSVVVPRTTGRKKNGAWIRMEWNREVGNREKRSGGE